MKIFNYRYKNSLIKQKNKHNKFKKILVNKLKLYLKKNLFKKNLIIYKIKIIKYLKT